ncbi:MAG: cytochrome b/b6 domain-containing protein [Candidatus Omnitrophica bacterium]|nr:cytochrome b/b6 domain-containing protein [Candidatus Omnitrophota bacterium]
MTVSGLMKNTIGLSGTFFLSVLVSVCATAQQAPQAPVKLTNQDCLSCHADNAPAIDPKAFNNSVHQTLDCIDCHKDIKGLPHADKLRKVDCAVCHEKEALGVSRSDHARGMAAVFSSETSCTACHGDPHAILEADDPRSPVNRKNIPLTCSGCHQKLHSALLTKEGKTYLKSVHGLEFQKGTDMKAAVCSDCHGAHDINKPANRLSRLYWVNIPETCGKCHKEEYKQYARGIHGQALAAGSRDTPVCTDCHGEHNIEAVQRASSMVSSANIPQTCGQCHAAQRINAAYGLPGNVLGSYMQSYHGLAMQQGTLTAANCASCHGAHEILPSSDPRSTINPRNLEKTCGQCHPGIGARVAQGLVHGGLKNGGNPVNDWVRCFYVFLIFFVSGILLLHNVLDFSKKAAAHYRHSLQQGRECMGFNERCQHFILTATFIILAYTGFSLKYPQTWWSFMFFGHNDWLRWGHRGTGLVFCALALYHLYYLFFTKKGLWQLKALSIRKEDFTQLFQGFQYYFGRCKDKPKPDGVYSYVQKLEYWALLWGSLVMVATGVLMFSEVWFLRMFPKWFYDVVRTVHLYEAILACVTIIIWHGYFVIFDPDVYPGNWSWLHGRSRD